MFFRKVGELAARYRYYVLGGWLLLAVVLNVAIPQLEDVIKQDATTFIPSNSQAMRAYQTMGEKFAGASGHGFAMIILENPNGLSAADHAYYADVVHRLSSARPRVESVQSYVDHPELKDALQSKDGKAIYIPTALSHVVGTPDGDSDAPWLREQLKAGRPADLHTYVSGTTAIIADFQESIQQSIAKTTLITGALLMVILFLIYRSPVTPVIPLTTIGIAIMVVRPIVALLGLHFIKVASFTETFILAIVFGAGTDYCIFLISRFKEQMAQGDTQAKAIATTWHRVGEAIASSAGTVLVGGVAMTTASVALFSTTGPAVGAAVVVTLVAGLTLTPALIAIGGERFFWPQRLTQAKESRFWTRAAALIVTRPRRILAWSLVPLVLLAALYPTMKLTYDERGPQPSSNDSIQGLHALDRHYQAGEVLPDYVLIQSDHDLRNATDLATVDAATRSASHVDGVTSVRSFTQPGGTRIEQASIPYQVGQVGQGLAQGSQKLGAASGGVNQLQNGAGQLASGAHQAQGAVDLFTAGLQQEDTGLGLAVSGSGAALNGSAQLRDGAKQLSAGLAFARDNVKVAVDALTKALALMALDPSCGISNSPCDGARQYVQAVRDGERDKLVPGLNQAVDGANRIAGGNGDLAVGLGQLHDGLVKAQSGIQQLEQGEQTFKSKLGLLAGGADQVSGGVGQLAGGTTQLKSGLDQASSFLNTVSQEAATAGIDTFFVPAANINDPRLSLARYYYISTDGTTARLMILGKDDPFGTRAMARVGKERDAVQSALKGTRLASAHVLIAGDAPFNANLESYFLRDFRVVGLAVLVGVLLVLILLLRSLVAPVYLLASVLLSYGASMGFTTLVWQDILGKGAIDWTVPIFAFVMLVSVGADYNIFLMSRVREEVLRDPANGIQHAVSRTGAIITSAGIIFAGTFAAMLAAPVINIVETGFAVTFGLLLDTFLVRSFVVPAVAVLLGRWNWWPHFGLKRGAVEALDHTGKEPSQSDLFRGLAPLPQPAR
jgi:RND superfamily putative drug exporter